MKPTLKETSKEKRVNATIVIVVFAFLCVGIMILYMTLGGHRGESEHPDDQLPSPVPSETDKIQLYVDYNFDSPMSMDLPAVGDNITFIGKLDFYGNSMRYSHIGAFTNENLSKIILLEGWDCETPKYLSIGNRYYVSGVVCESDTNLSKYDNILFAIRCDKLIMVNYVDNPEDADGTMTLGWEEPTKSIPRIEIR